MKTECDKCGTCCEKGGPALHTQDRELVSSGIISYADVVTIRQGEMVVQPDTGMPETSELELMKFQGKNGAWCCRFLDNEGRSCTIYEHRPHACRLLKCWEPDESLAIAGQKLLNRFDLIAADDPLLPLVRLHDQQCVLPDMVEVAVQLQNPEQRGHVLERLQEMVTKDLMFRVMAIDQFQLPVSRELFYLGRPLFQLLFPLGVTVSENADGIMLQYNGD